MMLRPASALACWLLAAPAAAVLPALDAEGSLRGVEPFPHPAGGSRGWSVLLDASGRRAALVRGVPPAVAEAAAWGSFTDAIDETGWAVLDIHTSADFGGAEQSYAAGFLEGALTRHRMAQQQRNMWGINFQGRPVGVVPPKEWSFSADNLRWMQGEADRRAAREPYWRMVGFLLQQLRGLTDGYNAAGGCTGEPLAPLAEVLMSSVVDTDMDDLIAAFVAHAQLAHERSRRRKSKRRRGHCSALVQAAPGNADLWTGHVTWDDYRGMLRIVKYLDMPLPGAASRRMVFTSQPGSLYSGDDFYVTDTGLTVLETTIENYNESLWKQVQPASVLTWVRAMVANRLATTGAEWTEVQLKHQSGTCNNQWMVVDYKRFQPGEALQDGTLWVCETMPGHSRRADVTQVLVEQGSWPSYNIPYFRDIWTVGGYAAMQADAPDGEDLYSFTHGVRARMFARARAEGSPADAASFMRLLRYNRQDDPLAKGDACNGISARCDLNPQWRDDYACFGGIDAKVTSFRRNPADLSFFAVSSPAYGEKEQAFSWRKQDSSLDGCKPSQHIGHPDTFDFSWYAMPSLVGVPHRDLELATAGVVQGPRWRPDAVLAAFCSVFFLAGFLVLRGPLRLWNPTSARDDYVLIAA